MIGVDKHIEYSKSIIFDKTTPGCNRTIQIPRVSDSNVMVKTFVRVHKPYNFTVLKKQ